jgi:GNAT superfamily N-acetyltransferase
MSGAPVLPETTLSLSVPEEGLQARGVVLRFPGLDDVDGFLPAFTDEELREAGNLPAFNREQLLASLQELPELAARGRLLALAAADAESGKGHRAAPRSITSTRSEGSSRSAISSCRPREGRGVATTIARMLAEHAFSLGIERVAAYVNVGNTASERVLERAGFTREGVVRSMPKPDGRRVDKTLFSLLPGE